MSINNNHQNRQILCLLTRTWLRDSHGLYDYESEQIKKMNLVLGDSVKITRKKNELQTKSPEKKIENDEELILNIKYEKYSTFIIDNPIQFLMQPTEENITNLSNKIWYVLKSEESNSTNIQTINNINDDYHLCKNDIIKLGRVKYALNHIHIPDKKNIIDIETPKDNLSYNIEKINIHSDSVFNFIYEAKNNLNENEDENMCKICYCNDNSNDNPLVNLCCCTGGIRFAHYFCIKKWMETKLIIKENEKKTVKSYNIKSFNCEICKTPYPCKIYYLYNLIIFSSI